MPLAQIFGRAARDRPFLHIEDLAATEAYRNRLPVTVASVELAGIRTFLGVPLHEGDAVVGIINMMRQEVRPFSEREIAIVQGFARQAQIAMKNARLMKETREALERQTATAEILKVIASSPSDVQPVFDAIAASAKRLLGGYSAGVFRHIDDLIHLVAFTPIDPEGDAALQALYPRPLSEFPLVQTIRGGSTAQFADTEAEDVPRANRDLARARGYRAMMFTPLMHHETPIGHIVVTRKEPGKFAPHHVQLLQTFADQAVIAINNVGLFNETQEALRQQTATSDVLKVISRSAFDLQIVLNTLTRSATTLCGASRGVIYLREGDLYRAEAAVGGGPDYLKFLKENPRRPGRDSAGAARRAFRRGGANTRHPHRPGVQILGPEPG